MRVLRVVSVKLSLILLGCVIAFGIAEVGLRIYQPFEFRLSAGRFVLHTNKQYVYNPGVPKLDDTIIYTMNSLGFRGPDPPTDFEDHLTIITIGGSTTEEAGLSDDKTWTHNLGTELGEVFPEIWVNNAGIGGMTTLGHRVLLEDHIKDLRPDVVLFLVGLNDQASSAMDWPRKKFTTPTQQFFKSLEPYSEVLHIAMNVVRTRRVIDFTGQPDLDVRKVGVLEIPPETQQALMDRHAQEFLGLYHTRLTRLITISRRLGMEPVLVTQPVLYGPVIDEATNVDLSVVQVDGLPGGVSWRILELYNQITRNVGTEQGVLVIELGRQLPKNSRYYYDWVHFTNEGAQLVADIINRDLCPWLSERYQTFPGRNCN